MNHNEYGFDWSVNVTHPVRPIPEPTAEQRAASCNIILMFVVAFCLGSIAIVMVLVAVGVIPCE